MGETWPDSFYPLVVQGFVRLGSPDSQSISRTILLKDGCLVGQRFECEGIRAVMRMGWDVIEFYGEDRQLLRVVALATEGEMKRAA